MDKGSSCFGDADDQGSKEKEGAKDYNEPEEDIKFAEGVDSDDGKKDFKEFKGLYDDDLVERAKRDSEVSGIRRGDKFRDAFEALAISALYVAFVFLGCIALVYVFHILSPKSVHYLDDSQLGEIKALLLTVIVSYFASHLKKRID